METEVQEVNCSVCLDLEVKDGLNNGADGRVQGRGTQMTVTTSPSSVITTGQRYPSGFATQQKHGNGKKDRDDRSRGIEILMSDTFAKIDPTDPFRLVKQVE